ncbi:hypothetical protein UB46_16955 [Burkholderiaceae bacterium 16]|nr:hypothetical protein UB46_16955 [Burkholderiaceae bacterium 16]
MQKRSLHWDDLLTLSTLIRTGNYSACARELEVTHATAIRRIRRLETALGKPVATRTDGAFALVREVPEVLREIWLAYPQEFRGASRFRPVIDWLAGELRQCP